MLDLSWFSGASLDSFGLLLGELENGNPKSEFGKMLRSCSIESGTELVLLTRLGLWALPDCSGLPSSSTKSILTGP